MLNNLNIVIVGTIRNVAKTLPKEVTRFNKLMGEFKRVQWLLIESDSTDKTPSVLKQLQESSPNFAYLSLGNLDSTIPERTERIAHCRNAYLQEIENNPAYHDIDLVVMADLDGINNVLTSKAIATCFERDDWDACLANTQGPYYDIWALRHPQWCPGDCLQEYKFLTEHGWHSYPARFAAIYTKMVTISPQAPWLEVDSAFAGLGFYKKASIKGHRYDAYEGSTAICEHVLFHQSIIKEGGKLYINPALLNCKNPPHSRKLRFPHSLKLRIRLFFNAVAKQITS